MGKNAMDYQLINKPCIGTTDLFIIGFNDKALMLETYRMYFSTALKQSLPHLMNQLQVAGDKVYHTDEEGHRWLFLYCGKSEEFRLSALDKHISELMQSLQKQRIRSATLSLPSIPNYSVDKQLQQLIISLSRHQANSTEYKTNKDSPTYLQSIQLHLPEANEKALARGKAIAEGMCFAQELANQPANVCTPTYLSQQARALAETYDTLNIKVLDKNLMEQMGMGAFLSVARGSKEPPQFIEIQYQGAPSSVKPIVLVGKGITFDSGGISLKPAEGMHEMKYDMAGAASVLGVMKACALLKLPLHVIGLLACTENMPSGSASKPGDVVKSLSGQTIEITNTDAEGRLVLADALTYAERFQPEFVIDIATLTGAIIVALGYEYSGLMTADEQLADDLLKAAYESGDKLWRMPLDKAYEEALESPIADMMNASLNRAAGSLTAATFLAHYTKAYRWAHLDIAGTAWVTGKNRHATGRPVPLLIQWLTDVAYSH